MELLTVDSIEQAMERLWEHTSLWKMEGQVLPISQSLGKVLKEDVYAGDDIPAFRRSTVDGYAVRSKDTAAAGETIPVFLRVKEWVEMGQSAKSTIMDGECAAVPTGGMVPAGADAVVMEEYSELFGAEEAALYRGAGYGENLVEKGEDAPRGSLLLGKGRRLKPHDIGLLAAAGVTEVMTFRPLRLALISTGDELADPGESLCEGKVHDVNTYALKALAEQNGFLVIGTAVLPDDENIIEENIRRFLPVSDIVAVSGGSSKGKKDNTRQIFDRVSGGGVFTHGLALKPGKPTILGYDAGTETLLAGLPGHPVSAMMVFELLLCRLQRRLTGEEEPPAISAKLACNVAASPGKTTCFPVKLSWNTEGCNALPIFGKSGLITTLTRADGYFALARGKEGLRKGEIVQVHLF